MLIFLQHILVKPRGGWGGLDTNSKVWQGLWVMVGKTEYILKWVKVKEFYVLLNKVGDKNFFACSPKII